MLRLQIQVHDACFSRRPAGGNDAGCLRAQARRRAQDLLARPLMLALGDSLTLAPAQRLKPVTHGAGAVDWLERRQCGHPGDTLAVALARLPALLQEHAPQLVLVGIGGNDSLRRIRRATRANIRRICEAGAGGAQVMLIAVPALSAAAVIAGSLSDHPPTRRSLIRWPPLYAKGYPRCWPTRRCSDQIYANAQVYEALPATVSSDAARAAQLL